MDWIAPYQQILTETQALNNAQIVADHFAGTDWTRESLSAMLGNMKHESSVNPNMYEFGYSWNADRGFGLVQWTPRSKYWDWATARGLEPRSGNSQLERINFEVDNNIQWIAKATNFNGLTFAEFRSNSRGLTVAELTEAFTWGYERPNASAGRESMPARIAFAQLAYDTLDWSGTGSGGSSGECMQLALLPIKILNVTQGEDGGFSHGGTLAMDFVGTHSEFPYYAPFDCECIGRDVPNAIATFKSIGPVMCADGNPRQVVFRCIHDANLPYDVGALVMKDELLGHTGDAGQSSGDHFHLDVWEGTEFTRTNPLHLYDVFAINGVEVVNTGGYDWIVSEYTCQGGGGSYNKNKVTVDLLMCDALNGWKW